MMPRLGFCDSDAAGSLVLVFYLPVKRGGAFTREATATPVHGGYDESIGGSSIVRS